MGSGFSRAPLNRRRFSGVASAARNRLRAFSESVITMRDRRIAAAQQLDVETTGGGLPIDTTFSPVDDYNDDYEVPVVTPYVPIEDDAASVHTDVDAGGDPDAWSGGLVPPALDDSRTNPIRDDDVVPEFVGSGGDESDVEEPVIVPLPPSDPYALQPTVVTPHLNPEIAHHGNEFSPSGPYATGPIVSQWEGPTYNSFNLADDVWNAFNAGGSSTAMGHGYHGDHSPGVPADGNGYFAGTHDFFAEGIVEGVTGIFNTIFHH